jgi:hypothetical protein
MHDACARYGGADHEKMHKQPLPHAPSELVRGTSIEAIYIVVTWVH